MSYLLLQEGDRALQQNAFAILLQSDEDAEEPCSDDAMHLPLSQWVAYASDYDLMQLDNGQGSIHIPCFDETFYADILASVSPAAAARIVFASYGDRGWRR